jgi:glycosyltransferase involved in cell wall biosynthesis
MVTPYNPFEKINGGVDAVNYNLSKSFVELGADVWMLTMGSVEKETEVNIDGVNLLILPDGGINGLWRRGYYFLRDGKKLIEKMEHERDIDIFIGESGRSTPLTFANLKKAKKIMNVCDLDGQELWDIYDCFRLKDYRSGFSEVARFAIRKLWREVYLSKTDALIFISSVPNDDFVRYYPILNLHNNEKYICEMAAPSPCSASTDMEKEYDFIYFGRIYKHKGVDLIIKANHLLKNNGLSPTTIIIGEGPWRERFERLSEKLDLGDNVKFLGYVARDKMIELILKSRFSISPSFYEAFGLTLEESWSLGVPTIASDIAIFRKRIIDGKNGFIFAHGNTQDLARIMNRSLCLNDNEYAKMCQNSISRMTNRSWIDVAREHIQLYQHLCK